MDNTTSVCLCSVYIPAYLLSTKTYSDRALLVILVLLHCIHAPVLLYEADPLVEDSSRIAIDKPFW